MLLLSENCLYGFKISSKKGLMLMLSSKKGLLRCYWDEICSHVLQTEFCCVCVCVCVCVCILFEIYLRVELGWLEFRQQFESQKF